MHNSTKAQVAIFAEYKDRKNEVIKVLEKTLQYPNMPMGYCFTMICNLGPVFYILNRVGTKLIIIK